MRPFRSAAERSVAFGASDGPIELATDAEALVRLANEPQPPLRFLAGSMAVQAAEEKLAGIRAEIERWRQHFLGTDGNFGDANVEGPRAQIQ
jgi:hypothetical protein